MQRNFGNKFSSFVILMLFFFIIQSCSSSTHNDSLRLSILHLNDTHSHLEPDSAGVNMVFDEINAKGFLGGFARIKTAVDDFKKTRQNTLFVHAGDAVQGTLYFTKFQGDADIDFLNLIAIDVMTFGNHEFDKGTLIPKKIVDKANFDIVSANIDFSREPYINERVKPYVIKYYGKQAVAVIGVTTEETEGISSPGPTIKFKNVIESLKKTVQEIESKGINKIIVLSHIGYDADMRVAEEVRGIDVIVGGHSHTLLGDDEYDDFGLQPEGPYPTVITRGEDDVVLIVHAWKWGNAIGALMVDFDEKGKIRDYKAEQLLLINDRFVQKGKDILPDSETYKKIIDSINKSKGFKIFSEDKEVLTMLAPLKAQIEDLKRQVITVAEDDLIVGLNSGPGPLVIDGFVLKTNVEIGLINRGSIRKDLSSGNITLGDVYEVMPFANTLCLINLKGSEIKQLLEDGIDYQIVHNPNDPYYPYVSGLTYTVKPHASKGNRVNGLMRIKTDGSVEPLHAESIYKFVTVSFIAKQGGDGYKFFNTYRGNIIDTGLIDADVFVEYLASHKSVKNPTEERIRIDTTDIQALKSYYIILAYQQRQWGKVRYLKGFVRG